MGSSIIGSSVRPDTDRASPSRSPASGRCPRRSSSGRCGASRRAASSCRQGCGAGRPSSRGPGRRPGRRGSARGLCPARPRPGPRRHGRRACHPRWWFDGLLQLWKPTPRSLRPVTVSMKGASATARGGRASRPRAYRRAADRLVGLVRSNATNWGRLVCWSTEPAPASEVVPCAAESLVP